MMKDIYKLLTLFLAFSLTSCLVDDTADSDLNDKSPSLIGFTAGSTDANIKATGDVTPFSMNVEVTGPTFSSITSDISGSVVVNEALTTAVEGTHFELDAATSSFTLSPDNNLIGNVSVNILTAGINPPLAESPVLALDIVTSSDIASVNGRTGTILITIKYLCASDLAGSYTVTGTYQAYDGSITPQNWTDTITMTGDGEYRTGRVGHWSAAVLGGTPGMTFTDLCGTLTIPSQNLVDLYSNIVEGGPVTAEGNTLVMSKVQGDGSIDFVYTISYGGNSRFYNLTYTPN
jgi:hypothetical protein